MPDKDTREMSDDELVRLAGRAQKINEAPVEALLRLKRSTEKLSCMMVILTVALVILTVVLVWQGFK